MLPSSQVRVLVVDDDPAICEYMQVFLTRDGIGVTTETDPTRVPDVVREGDFHLVVLDLMMPRLGGLETTQAIRSAERRAGPGEDAGLPIVAITAKASDADRQLCLYLGMNGFVSKPYRYEELQNLIAELAL